MQLSQMKIPIPAHSFNQFMDIDSVPLYTDKDMENLQKLGEILISHNAQGHFGISLIHKHYDLQDNEAVFERTSTNPKEFTISTGSFNNQNNISPCMWKFVTGETAIQATQWFQGSDSPSNIYSVTDNDIPLFMALRKAMIGLDCIERFGVGLLHRTSALSGDEILMEETNVESRQQAMKLTSLPGLDKNQSIQTLWSFSGTSIETMGWFCRTYCDYNSGHRNRHAKDGRGT